MKHLRAILFFLVCFIVVGFFSFMCSYFMLVSPETKIDSEYLLKYTDGTDAYYLQRADSNITFYLDGDIKTATSLYTLTDSEGNELPQTISKINEVQFKITPPAGGYEAGKLYTLTLYNDIKFSGSELEFVKKLSFCIEKEVTETFVYQDMVKIVKATNLKLGDNENLDISNSDVEEGSIIISDTYDEVYKVVEILEDGTAKVQPPTLDEIYSELEVYNEYSWDVDDLIYNQDLEIEIAENVKSSDFFKSLMMVAYAAEVPSKEAGIKVKCEPNNDENTMSVEIEVTLYPGKDGLFGMSNLKNHQVTIIIKPTLGMKVNCNIDGPVYNPAFDLSTKLVNNMTWSVDIGPMKEYEKEFDTDKEVDSSDMNEYQKNINQLNEKLANWSSDLTQGELKLFNWTLPVPSVPGLTFDAEVKLFVKLEMAANLKIANNSNTTTIVGLIYKNGTFQSYSDLYKTKTSPKASLIGKVKLEAGIKLEVRAKFVSEKIAYFEIDPQAGLYTECFAAIPINADMDLIDQKFAYGYFEAGVYFKANLKAYVNLAVKQYEFKRELVEVKSPILTMGIKKIARGITSNIQSVRALNTSFTAPDIIFEYYDVSKGSCDSEIISKDDIKYSIDGKELSNSGSDVLIPQECATSFYVTATYKNSEDSKSYSTLFKVIMSGSEIEGRVSEYTSGSDYKPISKATIKLYGQNDPNTMISSEISDEEGKFTFNVTEGSYILKISAPNYKELISLQEIAKDETKFTEHILLVDDSEIGNGAAGGQVNNAIDGKNMENVEIRLRNNWNNREGVYIDDSVTLTSIDGRYNLINIPVGYYTIEAKKENFYTEYFNIIVHSSDPQNNQNFTVSPILPENQIRIVLRWNEQPQDIDSHLIGLKPDGSEFDVYYQNMNYSFDGNEIANLDVDDMTSYGPETVTILNPIEGGWVYAVHDYTNLSNTNSDGLSYSGAYVTVFAGGRQVATYNVPVGQVGTYWSVFKYIDGQFQPINTINNTKPIP